LEADLIQLDEFKAEIGQFAIQSVILENPTHHLVHLEEINTNSMNFSILPETLVI